MAAWLSSPRPPFGQVQGNANTSKNGKEEGEKRTGTGIKWYSWTSHWWILNTVWFSYSASSHLIASDGIRSRIGIKRKRSDPYSSSFIKLMIDIPSLFFLFTLGWEGSLCFQFCHQWEPVLRTEVEFDCTGNAFVL